MPDPSVVDRYFSEKRFAALWQRQLIDDTIDDSHQIFFALFDAYNEPHRHYHTTRHIAYCLQKLDTVKGLTDHPDAIELAIWFHDIIYRPGQPDNEEKSAETFLQFATLVLQSETRNLVNRLIMATLHATEKIEHPDSRLMIDIDLSGFALPWKKFLRDSQNLRAEMPDITEEEFLRRQTCFHQRLLERPGFFLTEYFSQKYQQQARDNIAQLKASGL
ncbi:MAG: putative metal-dependent HD superfamily phosphohydrolase [Gammaproteobacteria bacterium]|jgi:predicted metal-dependent HD superfamily phosphohydrolase